MKIVIFQTPRKSGEILYISASWVTFISGEYNERNFFSLFLKERRILNVTFKTSEFLSCFSSEWTTVLRNSPGSLCWRNIHIYILYIPWVMGGTRTSAVFARFREDEPVGVITSLVRRTRHGSCQCASYLISIITLYAYQAPFAFITNQTFHLVSQIIENHSCYLPLSNPLNSRVHFYSMSPRCQCF